jgi:type I restriction enzyme S subunit
MNNLPPNWSWVKLGDVIGKDGVFVDGDWIESKDQDPNGEVRLIQLADIGEIEFRNKSDRYLTHTKALELKCTFIKNGDLLVARMPDPLGRTCIFPLRGDDKFVTVVDVAIIRIEKKIADNKFLCFIINAPQSRNKISELQSGSTRKRISRKHLSTIEFPLPPLPEQKKIVEKIEELFSGLDNGVASLKKAKEQIRLYRQSVLSAAFSGRLSNETYLNGVQVVAKAAEPTVEYSTQLPDGWKWVKTSDIIEFIDNGYTPKADFMYSGKGEIPFIKVYNLTFNGKLDFSKNPIFIDNETHLKNLKRSITIPDDVLINIVGPPLGKVTIVPNTFKEWNINQAIVRFRPNKNILSKFLSYYLQNPKTIQWLESTSRATAGQYNIKVSTCREIPIPQISIAEQAQIVAEIEKRFSEADNLEKAIDESLTKSETLRQSILKQAFSGKLIMNN